MEQIENPPDSTYQEWLKASSFAKFRYKWSLVILILCWVCLVILIFFVWHYQNELTIHPAQVVLESLDADYCYCYGGTSVYYINSTGIKWQDYSSFG